MKHFTLIIAFALLANLLHNNEPTGCKNGLPDNDTTAAKPTISPTIHYRHTLALGNSGKKTMVIHSQFQRKPKILNRL